MEQQFAADCNRRKATRWQFCAVVLGLTLWFRRKHGDTVAVKIQTLMLAGSTAAATGAVMAAKAAGFIYTTAFHILWVSWLLFIVCNRYLASRNDGATPSSNGHDQGASNASEDSVIRG